MGKLNDDTLKWTLEVNGKPAMKELNELEQSTRKLERTNKDLRVEMAKMEANGKKNTAEYKALGAQIKDNNATMSTNKTRMEQLRKEVGLSALTTKQLRDEYRRLKNQMDNTTPGTPEWKKLRGELTAVQGRMSDLNTTGKKTNSMFGQFKSLLPVLGVAALVANIGQLSRELLGLAIQLEGDNRRATIVFGESLSYVEGEAKKLSKAMGVTTKEFIAAAVGTADLLVPLDFTRDAAAKMSVQLQSLSGALDEWTGGRYGAAEVSNILTKAMLGENEQLKTLGIAIRKDSEEFTSLVKLKMQDATVTKAQAEAMATLELIQKKSLDAQTAYTQDGNELLRLQKDISRWWRQLKEDSTKYIYTILSGIKAIIEYKDVIIPAIVATTTYAVAMNAAAIKQNVFTWAVNIGQKAVAFFNKTVKSNPLVLLVSLLAGAATALYMFSTRTTAAQKAQKELDNVMLEGKKNIVEQKVQMELLLKIAKDEKKSKEERIKAINKLNEISPDYLGNLTLETINTNEAKKATDLYILSLEKKARVQAAQEKLAEIERKLLDLRVEGVGAETSFWQKVSTGLQTFGDASSFAAKNAEKVVSNWKEKEDELLKTKEKLLDVIEKTNEAQTIGGGGGEEIVNIQSLKIELAKLKTARETIAESDKAALAQNQKEIEAKEAQIKALEDYGKTIIETDKIKEKSAQKAFDPTKLSAPDSDIEYEKFKASELQKYREEDLKAIEDKYKREKTLAETKYNDELLALGSDEKAKKALKLKFDADELQRNMDHLIALKTQLEQSLSSVNMEDSMLTDEERDALLAKIDELKLAISALKLLTSGEETDNTAGEVAKLLFGIDGDDSLMARIAKVGQFASTVFSQINKIISNGEQRQLQEFQQSNNAKKQALDERLKSGKISQDNYNSAIADLDEALDKKKRKIDHDQAVRTKALGLFGAIVNTAGGIARALVDPGGVAGIILAVVAGVMGALQIAAIASEPIPALAAGNRQKILADDGKTYNAKVASQNHQSGLYNEPTYVPGFGLFGETRDPELVFNPDDTQRIINSPALIDAINMTLGGARQYANGNSREIIRESNTVTNTTMDAETMALLADIRKKLDEPATAYLVADEDYIRIHQKKVTEYDTFKKRIGN
jgi:hypothetical protein